MHRLFVLGIACLIGGWLAFDGSRALIVGEYVTPRSGRAAGQLGPWSRVVTACGLDPRGTLVKALHLLLGIAWLCGAAWFLVNESPGRIALIIVSFCTLWYLPIGTALSVLEIALLIVPSLRAGQ